MDKDDEQHIRKLQRELIGRRYEGATLSSMVFRPGDGEKVSKWIQTGKNFLVFLGGAGIGKTYFCSSLIPWIYKKVPNFRYWEEREFQMRVRSIITEDRGDYMREVQWTLDDHFVMIDDLGSCGFTDWKKEITLAAIDQRYESEMPTVFTSNLTRKQISDGLGFRSASRLFAAENLIIEMHDAKDQRQVLRERP